MDYQGTLRRGWKSLGFAGPAGFLLVCWAASHEGGFNGSVFGLSFAALCLCWARTWVLVPDHERIVERDRMEWERYGENDWRLLEIFAEFSGVEIDNFRADVANAANETVRATLMSKAPTWDDEDVRRFLEYFVEDLSHIGSVYVDSEGKLQDFD